MMGYYILDEQGGVLRVDTVEEWGPWFENADRTVARDEREGVVVSTVFLALDHAHYIGGPPLLWETMVFGGPHDLTQWRYTSRAAAEAGHAEAVALALP